MKIVPKTGYFKTCGESLKGKTALILRTALFTFTHFLVVRDLMQGFL
jgi:hypothetical protein